MKTLLLISYFVLSLFTQISNLPLNYKITQSDYNDNFIMPLDIVKQVTNSDSSCQKKKYKFFQFDDKLNNLNKIDIDSLIKKFRVQIDIDKYLNEDYLKKFENNLPKFWEEFPKFDKRQFDELLKDLDKNMNKDSLLNRFKFFRKNNLFDESEIIEI